MIPYMNVTQNTLLPPEKKSPNIIKRHPAPERGHAPPPGLLFEGGSGPLFGGGSTTQDLSGTLCWFGGGHDASEACGHWPWPRPEGTGGGAVGRGETKPNPYP